MIKLRKGVVPDEIQQQINERTQRYLRLTQTGEPIPESLAAAYKEPQVKELLRAETSDKCAYCESKVSHVDYGDVEHILPKAVAPDRRFDYTNLTYACGVCNTKKGAYYSEECPLINPYTDDPSDHFIALGPMVVRQPRSDRGLLTERRLDMNRAALIERRAERLNDVATLVDQIARTTSPSIREVLLEQASQECLPDKEFSFVVASYVAQVRTALAGE